VGFPSRESKGSFEYGNYWTEVDDLHAVAQHFRLVGHIPSLLIPIVILLKKRRTSFLKFFAIYFSPRLYEIPGSATAS
jgi:hypothetical protein